MSKHTPGPWRVVLQKGKYEGSFNIGREADSGKGPLLTFVVILGPNDITPPEYGAAAKANAHLIAAAPDLLAACEAMVSWIDRNPFLPSGEFLGLDDHMKAAIARAKGEAGQ